MSSGAKRTLGAYFECARYSKKFLASLLCDAGKFHRQGCNQDDVLCRLRPPSKASDFRLFTPSKAKRWRGNSIRARCDSTPAPIAFIKTILAVHLFWPSLACAFHAHLKKFSSGSVSSSLFACQSALTPSRAEPKWVQFLFPVKYMCAGSGLTNRNNLTGCLSKVRQIHRLRPNHVFR